jgi:hypothetical protein
MIFGDFQLTRRAQHALAWHTAHHGSLDEKRRTTWLAGWQFGTNQGSRHTDANPDIGRTTDDGKRCAAADIDLADIKSVSIRMALDLEHFTDHHLAKRRCGRVTFFYFQATHGQQVGEPFTIEFGVGETAQPAL